MTRRNAMKGLTGPRSRGQQPIELPPSEPDPIDTWEGQPGLESLCGLDRTITEAPDPPPDPRVSCERCQGLGSVPDLTCNPECVDIPYMNVCPRCHGSGLMPPDAEVIPHPTAPWYDLPAPGWNPGLVKRIKVQAIVKDSLLTPHQTERLDELNRGPVETVRATPIDDPALDENGLLPILPGDVDDRPPSPYLRARLPGKQPKRRKRKAKRKAKAKRLKDDIPPWELLTDEDLAPS